MDYPAILKQSLKITWNHKILWFLGMLFGGGYSIGNLSINSSDFQRSVFTKEAGFFSTLAIADFLKDYWILLIIIFFLIFILLFISFVLSVSGRGAIYHGVNEAVNERKIYFTKSLYQGFLKFWPILGSRILFFLLILFLGIAMVLFILINIFVVVVGWLYGIFLFICYIFAFIALSFLITIIANYLYCYLVLEKKSLSDAIKASIQLFRKNLEPSLLMGGIIFGINIVISLVTFIIMVIFFLVFLTAGFLAYAIAQTIGVVLVVFAGFITFLVVIYFIRGLTNTYFSTCWLFTWRSLVDKK